MKCPDCANEGTKSRVRMLGSTSTLLANEPWWDEEGKYHYHDMNWHSTEYSCSLGHSWLESWLIKCPQGDYGGDKVVA